MGLFSRNTPDSAPPVSREKVMGLLQAYMAESDADPDGSGAASDALGRLARESTPAEYGAAVEAARRNGY